MCNANDQIENTETSAKHKQESINSFDQHSANWRNISVKSGGI